MKLQRNLWFVRHAESIGNVLNEDERAKLMIPNHEYPLTDTGCKQAELTGEFLKEFNPKRFRLFFHSNYRRTRDTLDIILKTIGRTDARPICDPRLDEKWEGIFHDLTKAEIEAKYPEQLTLRERTGYYLYRAPGGQSGPDIELQIRSFLHDYFRSYEAGDVLICGHGRWSLFLLKLLYDLPISYVLELRKQEACGNCSVMRFEVFANRKEMPEFICPWKGRLETHHTEFA